MCPNVIEMRESPRRAGGLLAVMAEGRPVLTARPQGPPDKYLNKVADGFAAFKDTYNARIAAVEASVDEQAASSAHAMLHGGGVSFRSDDPQYTAAFTDYFRSGLNEDEIREANATGQRAQVQAAMSVTTPDSGGYLAPTEWDRRISQAQLATSPMRRLATVKETTVGAYTTLWNTAEWGSGWVGETAARPATTTSSLMPITFASGEIYAMPAITQRLLDDAGLDVEQWMAEQIETEFNRQEGIAFLTGNGVNKPFGFLTYVPGGAGETQHPAGVLGQTLTGDATTIPDADALIGFTYALAAPYRQNATWLMNSATAATIAKMKDGDGNLIWRESLMLGQPSTLLGRPVEIDEGMPAIGAGTYPIAFGDFRAGYLINDRIGTRILRDPYTNKPYVVYYVTKRVGAGVADPNAIRLLKVAAA